MTAKQITVVEKGSLRGLVLNPRQSELAEGTVHQVSRKAVLEAAIATGIENYSKRLESNRRVGLKPNNKVLAPSIRALFSTDTPPKGDEVNKMTTTTKNGHPEKGSQEAKDRMAKARAARKSNTQEQNTTLVLDAPSTEGTLDSAIAAAREHGEWGLVELLVNQKHS